ncbi:MAG: FecR domain-containing protein [Sphingobacterium sp.]|uniref:FecR family protein n=1 Tax=Sphingobacterium sp. TaxID=341027 RepID=UPI0028444A3C|nr:FecR domain-containing protein [Sphingobacterium sp.]MDR3009639.1 FecR domain-containing protein [Sphingobacterium sp.]
MKRRIFESLIERYRQNKASANERRLIDHWYAELDKEDIPKYHVDENQIWGKIHRQIGNTPTNKMTVQKMLYWSGAVAACLLLCLSVLFWSRESDQALSRKEISLKPGFRIFETGVAQRKRVQLADGSTVILNARTKLKLDTVSFDRKDRIVELLAGEAFFDVKKDSTKAFIVNAQQIQTRVLGTSFTVKNYAELDDISVSVFTGKVQVSANSNPLGVLTRGEQIRYARNSTTSRRENFDLLTRNSWIEGRVYLKQSSFAELALAVRNIYGVELEAADSLISQQFYSMPLSRQLSWSATLESIQAIHHNKSRKEGNKVLIY